MAKGFIAIDTQRNIHEFSEEGIKNLKRLHETQKVKGWQYGLKEQKNELLSKVITTEEALTLCCRQNIINERPRWLRTICTQTENGFYFKKET